MSSAIGTSRIFFLSNKDMYKNEVSTKNVFGSLSVPKT